MVNVMTKYGQYDIRSAVMGKYKVRDTVVYLPLKFNVCKTCSQ